MSRTVANVGKASVHFGLGLALLTTAASLARAQSVERDAGGYPEIVMTVAYYEGEDKYNFGTLRISRSRVSYDAVNPPGKNAFDFEVPIREIRAARPGEQLDLRYVEIHFHDYDSVYFHEAESSAGGYRALKGSPRIFAVAAAINDFDATVEALDAPLKDGNEPVPPPQVDGETIRYLVSRGEKQSTYSYGWLEIDEASVGYDVLWPEDMKSQSWQLDRSRIRGSRAVSREGWRWIEIVPENGEVQSFASCLEVDFGYYVARPHSTEIFDAVDAIEAFDEKMASLKSSSPPAVPADAATNDVVEPPCKGYVYVRSEPASAEIWVDGELLGSAPAKLSLNEGERTIQVRKTGYAVWERRLRVTCNGISTLVATLEAK